MIVENQRGYIFNAGPAALPTSVLEKMRDELLVYKDTGMSVMELSHRSKPFQAILDEATQRAKRLLNIPDEYSVLFLQGGARLQFAMLPINFYIKGKPIDLIHTGAWTKQAMGEMERVAEFNVVATSEDKNFSYLPKKEDMSFNPEASYLHLCSNNTIFGTQWSEYPDTGDVPLVADMTSDIFSRFFDIKKFGAVFASAQKNLGMSGVTLVIIRNDLAERCDSKIPTMLQYRSHIKANSLFNTAPTYPIYVAGLILEWIEDQGGLSAIEKLNQEKANLLYDAVDSTGYYQCPVQKEDRSLMNVVFRVDGGNEEKEAQFIKEAEAEGFLGLKGHRSVGGLRASIYNAMPTEGVKGLVDFMKSFEQKNG